MKTVGLYKTICAAAVAVVMCACGSAGDVVAATAESDLDTVACFSDIVEERAASVRVEACGKVFTYKDEPIVPSDFTVAEKIELLKINAPVEEKIEYVDMCLQKGADYKTALSMCFPLLPRFTDRIAETVNVAPVDAAVVYKNGKFGVTREKSGVALDENKLYAGIYFCFKFGETGRTLKADTVTVPPAVTAKELSGNLTLRSEYKTDYKTSTAQRAHNVSLALSKFDGLSVAPGQRLSFNTVVGDRTEENGFRKAKIIVDGKYTDGVGGGVCQASTALYNAALTAGLAATANAHSICPSYCPPGLDAMISSFSDLVITNTTAHDIYISVRTGNGAAAVKIFGEKQDVEVVPESVVTNVVPHRQTEILDAERKYFGADAVKGDRLIVSPGKDGMASETYLNYYKNGTLIRRTLIRQNSYKPTPCVVAVAP